MRQGSYGVWVLNYGFIMVGGVESVSPTPSGLAYKIGESATVRRYGDSSISPADGGGIGCIQRGEMKLVSLEPVESFEVHEANVCMFLEMTAEVAEAFRKRIAA